MSVFLDESKLLLRVLIPTPLPPESSPNWRGHWAARYKAIKAWQAPVVFAIRSDLPSSWEPIRGSVMVSLSLNRGPRRKPLDDDNAIASCKPLLDAMTIAGVWGDDRLVTLLPIQQQKQTKEGNTHYPAGSIEVSVYRGENDG